MSNENEIRRLWESGIYHIEIEVSEEWSNENQSNTGRLQYQCFTNKNQSCAPSLTIAGAIKNARQSIKEKILENERIQAANNT